MFIFPPWINSVNVPDGAKIMLAYLWSLKQHGTHQYPTGKMLVNILKKEGRTIRNYQLKLEKGGWLWIERDKNNRATNFGITDPYGGINVPHGNNNNTKTETNKGLGTDLPPSQIEKKRTISKEPLAKNEARKERREEEKRREEKYSYAKEVEKLLLSSQRHIQIIGIYFLRSNPTLENKEQFNSEMRRHLRVAARLSPYSDDRIHKAIDICEGEVKEGQYSSWSMETVEKKIAKVV